VGLLKWVLVFRVFYYVVTFLLAVTASYLVFSKAYGLASSYGDSYVSDEIYYVDSSRRILERVFNVSLSYHSYSGRTAGDYFNLEHPPLGKYIIALSMATCGDKPLCWRLPGVIEVSLIPLILYITYAATRHPLGPLAGSVAALAASTDPVLHRVGSVALLDPHLAFFTTLSLALAVHGRYVASALFAGISVSVKISGLGTMLGYMLSLYKVDGVKRRLAMVLLAIALTAIVQIAIHAPLALYFGPWRMVEETVNAIKWHTTSRPPDGPPYSSPSGWILNVAPFPLTFNPTPVKAELNTILHLVALAYSTYILVLGLIWGLKGYRVTAPLYYAGVTLAYWAVYIAGNRTLYSFYAIQLTPLAAATIAELLLQMARPTRGSTQPTTS
jgi:predicted membrane-bound dolichyl-phosphate-mannose-protein mannosyltransferase